jgi:hypothetical protein
MEQKQDNLIINLPPKSKAEGCLFQRVEAVFKRNGMDPKWDYSRADQAVIMPVRKKRH